MPYATAEDGVSLFYEEVGAGRPVIFLHEFAGNYHFARRYRCIAFNARGYPPSDVPESESILRYTWLLKSGAWGSLGNFRSSDSG